MTVQTFEEYADHRGTTDSRWKSWREWPNTEKNHARLLFADGMRNAAEVADDLSCGYHSPYEYEKDVADAIREAARGG